MNGLTSWLDPVFLRDTLVVLLPVLLKAALVVSAFWLIQRATKAPLKAALRRGRLDETLVTWIVDSLYGSAVLVLGVIMAASQLGIDVTTMLAGLSVIGIALGIAAQDTVANMISGFLIFWDKPFVVGDYVDVADEYGKVTEITLRTTRIRTLDNTYVVIPNKTIIDSVLDNHSKHGEVRLRVPIDIAYKEYIPAAREALEAAVRRVPDVMPDPPPQVVVDKLGDSGVSLIVFAWVADAAVEKSTFFSVLEASKLALDAARIEIPYHHLQLFIENVDPRAVEQLSEVARRALSAPRSTSRLPEAGRPGD